MVALGCRRLGRRDFLPWVASAGRPNMEDFRMASKTRAAIGKGWWNAITKFSERFFLLLFALMASLIAAVAYFLWDWLAASWVWFWKADATWPVWVLCLLIVTAALSLLVILVATVKARAQTFAGFDHTTYTKDRFGDGPLWRWDWPTRQQFSDPIPYCPTCDTELPWKRERYLAGGLYDCDAPGCVFEYRPDGMSSAKDCEEWARSQIDRVVRKMIREHTEANGYE